MKVSEQWLREWVQLPPILETKQLGSILTLLGLEVDQTIPAAGAFTNVVVALVRSTQSHPEADKLTICEVDCGDQHPLQVVCGASNVRAGLKVALAKIGAVLPNGFTIKAAVLRQQASNGMLCSAVELGMAETSEGILELEDDAPIGMDFRDYLQLDDTIFDIDLTANRGDCLSMKGMARELSAKLDLPLVMPEVSLLSVSASPRTSVRVEAKEACPLYMGAVIRGVNSNASTPVWMRERLRRAGIRPIHPVVDITQYVMLECGQPLHAFDKDKVEGELVVRYASAEESLTLLTGEQAQLAHPVLLVADPNKPLAMAGIMGGQSSSVTTDTTTVFLESAFFAPRAVAGVARKYGLMTDASMRFERGVDPAMPQWALARAVALLETITGGQLEEVISAQQESPLLQERTVVFRPSAVLRLVGLEIPTARMRQILTALGFELLQEAADQWTLRVPSYRFDIAIEEDIVEEMIRVEGYDQLPKTELSVALRAGHVDPMLLLEQRLVTYLAATGYRQVMTYSFVDPSLQRLLFEHEAGLVLQNPISAELSEMRLSLWPGLLAAMLYNLNRQQTAVALLEAGRVFSPTGEEQQKVAMLLTGTRADLNWAESTRPFDFYDLKGHIASLCEAAHITFERGEHAVLHPGKTALLMREGVCVGFCGALHPRIAQALDLSSEVLLLECELSAFAVSQCAQYTPISKFPQIRRDLALLADVAITFEQIKSVILGVENQGILKAVDVFDVYMGTGVPEGQKSIAIALLMQSHERTLQDAEVNALIQAILTALQQQLSVRLREAE